MAKIPGYIQAIVRCVDDSNQPDNIGDFPEKGKYYEVEEVTIDSRLTGDLGFVLKGLYPNGRYGAYLANRFRVDFEELNLN